MNRELFENDLVTLPWRATMAALITADVFPPWHCVNPHRLYFSVVLVLVLMCIKIRKKINRKRILRKDKPT